jgi:hypothetical protein
VAHASCLSFDTASGALAVSVAVSRHEIIYKSNLACTARKTS